MMASRFSDSESTLTVTDYRDLMMSLRKVEPSLIKQMRNDIKDIASPIREDVKTAIPSIAPLSGMSTKVGRLSWTKTMNTTKPLKSVTVEIFRRPNLKYQFYSLARIRVMNASVVLSDMMGRSGKSINSKSETREYDYTYHKDGAEIIGKRKHKINGQGAIMIQKMNGRAGRTASRFTWPAAERALPHAKLEIRKSLERAYGLVNLEMLRRGK